MADFDPLRVGASVQTYPGLAITNIRLKWALFNRLLAMMQGTHSKLAWEIVFWFLFGNIKISLNECETIRK